MELILDQIEFASNDVPMDVAHRRQLLETILRDVSRSFFLSLRILPAKARVPMGAAYLLARAADTVADSSFLPQPARLEHILLFRRQLTGAIRPAEIAAISRFVITGAGTPPQKALPLPDGEQRLMACLPECFALCENLPPEDRMRVAEVVVSLTKAMEIDLRQFKDAGHPAALERFADLEDYTYHAAGCVGPFWTKTCMAHLRRFSHWNAGQMCNLGIRFGKALQWTNILRDIPKDLERGRCYLPESDLAAHGLHPTDLRLACSMEKLRPLYNQYLDHALEHYRSAWQYTLSIPRSCPQVRLACIWPVWIGLETLALLRNPSNNPLQGEPRLRISRSRVYSIMRCSALRIWSDRLLDLHHQKLVTAAS
ncbi:MAG: phytoene/squalene synthase family protein [Verrucomicrobiae bacterium]|nr:phytoene/squalene synthase family protein [Verrucomicrobiae bacterium]